MRREVSVLVALLLAAAATGCGANLNVSINTSTPTPAVSSTPSAPSTPAPTPVAATPTPALAPVVSPPAATAAPGPWGDGLPYAPANPGEAFACLTASTNLPMYRVNECAFHAAFVNSRFAPFAHAGQTVCYEVLLDGPQSAGYRTLLFTCSWSAVPEGA